MSLFDPQPLNLIILNSVKPFSQPASSCIQFPLFHFSHVGSFFFFLLTTTSFLLLLQLHFYYSYYFFIIITTSFLCWILFIKYDRPFNFIVYFSILFLYFCILLVYILLKPTTYYSNSYMSLVTRFNIRICFSLVNLVYKISNNKISNKRNIGDVFTFLIR